MSEKLSILELLGIVLSYPDQHYHHNVSECRWRLEATCLEAADLLQGFEVAVAEKTLSELEELYMQTFDMCKTCTLDMGWHLFGEDYNRGLFLAKLRQAINRLGIKESRELPDHITHVLAILSRMESEDAEDFALSCVIPAVKKNYEGMKKDNLFTPAIEGLLKLLETQFGQSPNEATHV